MSTKSETVVEVIDSFSNLQKSMRHFSCGNVEMEKSAVNSTVLIVHCMICDGRQRISFQESFRLLKFATDHQHQLEKGPEALHPIESMKGHMYPFITDEYIGGFSV
jgi:hypothetical protein